jgi:hypothetical protein
MQIAAKTVMPLIMTNVSSPRLDMAHLAQRSSARDSVGLFACHGSGENGLIHLRVHSPPRHSRVKHVKQLLDVVARFNRAIQYSRDGRFRRDAPEDWMPGIRGA